MKKCDKIIIISENEKITNSISECLQKTGYDILRLEHWEDTSYTDQIANLVLINNTYFLNKYIIENLRNRFRCPIIIFLEGEYEETILKCLSYEAEDYIIKPIRKKELIGKVKFYIESNKKQCGEEISGVVFNDIETSITIEKNKIKVTKNEYLLCKILAKNPFLVMSKQNLYDSIYKFDTDTQIRTITEYIYSIRSKFKEINMNPIKTIWGVGYKWETG